MREILFRGKPTDRFADFQFCRSDLFTDGWIYGSLVICEERYYICVYADCSNRVHTNNAHATMVEVIPETAGQFTGKCDKSGTKIFEGDVVLAKMDYGPAGMKDGAAIIEFNNDCGGYEWQYLDMPTIMVIDNIHDNPRWLAVLTKTTEDIPR